MKEGKISIIVPVYNTKEYLRCCIESIQNQTYNNLEIICVDDGSTDGSGEILDELSREDNRLIVFHTENRGVANARNTGMLEANGEYIGFVDSDDYLDRDMFSRLVKEMDNPEVDIVTCRYYFDYNNGEIVPAVNQKSVPQDVVKALDFLPYMYERDTYKGVGAYLWTRLFRTRLIKADNQSLLLSFMTDITGYDDVVFNAKAMLRCNKIVYIDKPLYYYVQRENSIMHSNYKIKSTMKWVEAYRRTIGLFKENSVSTQTLDYVVRMYVYRCGKTLEDMLGEDAGEDVKILQEEIKKYLDVYMQTNKEYPERIEWANKLLAVR